MRVDSAGEPRAEPGGWWLRFFAAGWVHFVAILFTVAGVLLVVFGLVLVLLRDTGESWYWCNNDRSRLGDGAELSSVVEFERTLIPMRAVCRWEDGYSYEYVPSFVNPGIALCIATSTLAVVVITVLNRRYRGVRAASAADRSPRNVQSR